MMWKAIPHDNIPVQFMIVDDIPINANGKLDIFKITRERLEGDDAVETLHA